METSIMTLAQEQKDLRKLCNTSNWRSVVALTLNLKGTIPTSHGGFMPMDELQAKSVFRHFSNRLNREVYGAAYRKHDKRVQIIPILEKSHNGHWHYHVAVEPPTFMSNTAFAQLAVVLWESGHSGARYGQVEPYANEGWISYITK